MIRKLFALYSSLGNGVALFIVSVIPFIELRGAIPFGICVMNMPWYEVFLISFLSNLLPIPVVVLFSRPIFAWLKKTKLLKDFVEKLETKMMRKSEQVLKYKMFGLFLFVAIPLPGTGAYSGALIASLLDMSLKKSFISIAAGVFVAGVIVTLLSVLSRLGINTLLV